MSIHNRRLSRKQLAAYLLLFGTADAQSSTANQTVVKVTSVTTFSGNSITEIYTPTSLSISGLTPPITSGITITTTDSAGETVAIAVAAGAGVVAAGALAAWLFKPVPGAPSAPTTPPEYSTKSPKQRTTTTTFSTSTTVSSSSSSETYACPFPKSGYSIDFKPVPKQPQWTAALPIPSTVSSHTPECTQSGDNGQLLRGTDPGYVDALAKIFCKGGLAEDRTATLGQSDLPDDSTWKNADLDSIRVKFGFEHRSTHDGCEQNCIDAQSQIVTRCEYNSHVLYGGGSLVQGCGNYNLVVEGDPRTKLTCNSIPDPINQDYEYRDAVVEAINNVCIAQDGKVLEQNDESTDVKERAFKATYSNQCQGSGTYTISKDTCVKYLTRALDSCDTETTMYKHGGTVTDVGNCGAFTFHPFGYDVFACYPRNDDAGYVSGTHVQVTPEMAQDAISQFCDRNGDDQKYTLNPDNIPDSSSFTADTCTQSGMAYCGYYYNDDGTRAEDGSVGNILIRMEARYFNPDNFYTCSTNQVYEIHGERCHQELGKVIGVEPQGQCVGDDPNKLDLGSFVENGDKGCVLWNMWAVGTL